SSNDTHTTEIYTLSLHDALPISAKDANEMDRMFRKSGLFRKKWDQIHYADGSTYGEVVINKAIEGTSVVFTTNEIRTPLKPKQVDRKSTRLNSSHVKISYAVFCL